MPDDLDGLAATFTTAGAQLRAVGSRIIRKGTSDAVAIAKANAPVDTGYHREGIGMDVIDDLTAAYGCTSNYGPFLEDGTYKMPPRPHIRPAIDPVLPSIEKALGDAAVEVFR